MKLSELEPQLLMYVVGGITKDVASFATAQGVMFLCPLCFEKNGGAEGTHRVRVWFDGRGVPAEAQPSHRWSVAGASFDELTITPSIHIHTGCQWHGWVTKGEAK